MVAAFPLYFGLYNCKSQIMSLNKYAVLFLMSCFLMSCHKDFEEKTERIIENRPPELVDGKIVGMVTDENGIALQNYQINLESNTIETGNYALYSLTGTDMNAHGQLISTINPNGETQYFTLFPHPNDISYTRMPHYLTSEYEQADDNNTTSVDFSNGGSILLPADASLLNGQDFNGSLSIGGQLYDLTNLDHLNSLPGGQLGKDKNNIQAMLTIYSAMYIDLKNNVGEPLTLKENKSISAQFPNNLIPNNFSGELALWFYNTNTHVWEFSKTIENEDTQTIDQPGHWCIASSNNFIKLSGNLKFEGNPIPNHEIQLSWFDNQPKIRAYTSNKGNWFAFVPQNERINIKAINHCGNVLIDEDIPGQADDFEASSLQITNADLISKIEGKARDCMDDLLEENLNILMINGHTSFHFSTESDFDFYTTNCEEQKLSLQLADLNNQQFGANIDWQIKEEMDVHNSYACESAKQEYLTLRIESDKKIYWSPSSKFENGDRATLFVEDPANPDLTVEIYIPHENLGIQPDEILNILLNDPDIGDNGISLFCPTSTEGCGFEIFEVTHYGTETGEWIRGYFEGRFWMKNLDPSQAGFKNMNGDFQIFREF